MVQYLAYLIYGSLMNTKIYLICHGFGEQIFLEGIINKYIKQYTFVPVKTLSPNRKVHKSSVQLNNLFDVFKKSLIAYKSELCSNSTPYFIIMIDTEERDQNLDLEARFVNAEIIDDLNLCCQNILNFKCDILCLYSKRGIENAITEVYPNLTRKNGVTHIQLAKPNLSVELFDKPELRCSNLYLIKSFLDNIITR